MRHLEESGDFLSHTKGFVGGKGKKSHVAFLVFILSSTAGVGFITHTPSLGHITKQGRQVCNLYTNKCAQVGGMPNTFTYMRRDQSSLEISA